MANENTELESTINSDASPEPKVVQKPDETPAVTTVKKLELSQEELDAKVAEGVAKQLSSREDAARKEEAKRQGNFKVLFEESDAARVRAELALYRSKAIAKYKLSDKFFDALSGETEEEIMKSAKNLRSAIDEEIKAKETVAPPLEDGTRKRPTTPASTGFSTKQVLEGAFGLTRRPIH